MIVKKLVWFSESAQEAILFIGDDSFECAAFSHPCNLYEGDSLTEPLFALSVKGVIKIQKSTPLAIHRQGESFVHEIIAKVIDQQTKIVAIGSIRIELDEPIPGDISSEDVIQFTCNRLDVIA